MKPVEPVRKILMRDESGIRLRVRGRCCYNEPAGTKFCLRRFTLQRTCRESTMRRWRQAAIDGLQSGSIASLTSTLALSICGWLERRRPAAPNNGPSQWVWGTRAAYETRATLRHTAVGYAVHHAMSVFWGVLHEKTFGGCRRKGPSAAIAEGIATAAVAAFVDYRLMPERLQPGFDKHLHRPSLVVVYVAFGLGLGIARLMRNSGAKEISPASVAHHSVPRPPPSRTKV
jgi:hypothetical protein